jgi:hypothetical protein
VGRELERIVVENATKGNGKKFATVSGSSPMIVFRCYRQDCEKDDAVADFAEKIFPCLRRIVEAPPSDSPLKGNTECPRL